MKLGSESVTVNVAFTVPELPSVTVLFPTESDGRLGPIFATQASPIAVFASPLAACRAPAVVGKSDDLVVPATYAYPFASAAIFSAPS